MSEQVKLSEIFTPFCPNIYTEALKNEFMDVVEKWSLLRSNILNENDDTKENEHNKNRRI